MHSPRPGARIYFWWGCWFRGEVNLTVREWSAFAAHGCSRGSSPRPGRIDIGKDVHWALDDAERDKILASAPKNAKPEISRFKGLGEMTAQELKETTLDVHRRCALRVTIEHELQTDKLLNDLMGKDASARFEFIMEQAPKADAGDLDL
ncbi:MAG: hypothetical protein R3A47_06525 [Polyangiales bacterium]